MVIASFINGAGSGLTHAPSRRLIMIISSIAQTPRQLNRMSDRLSPLANR